MKNYLSVECKSRIEVKSKSEKKNNNFEEINQEKLVKENALVDFFILSLLLKKKNCGLAVEALVEIGGKVPTD